MGFKAVNKTYHSPSDSYTSSFPNPWPITDILNNGKSENKNNAMVTMATHQLTILFSDSFLFIITLSASGRNSTSGEVENGKGFQRYRSSRHKVGVRNFCFLSRVQFLSNNQRVGDKNQDSSTEMQQFKQITTFDVSRNSVQLSPN